MNIVLGLIILALATARGTRLIADDYITEPFRNAVQRRFGDDSKLTYLVNCRFCCSFWLGFVAAGAAWLLLPIDWPWIVPLALTFSAVAILWLRLEDGDT